MHLIPQSGKPDGCSPEDRPTGVYPPEWRTMRCSTQISFVCFFTEMLPHFAPHPAVPLGLLVGYVVPDVLQWQLPPRLWRGRSHRLRAAWIGLQRVRSRQAETLSLTPAQAAHLFQARYQEEARPQTGCVNACRQPALLTCSDAGAAMQVINPRSRVGSDSGECVEAED